VSNKYVMNGAWRGTVVSVSPALWNRRDIQPAKVCQSRSGGPIQPRPIGWTAGCHIFGSSPDPSRKFTAGGAGNVGEPSAPPTYWSLARRNGCRGETGFQGVSLQKA